MGFGFGPTGFGGTVGGGGGSYDIDSFEPFSVDERQLLLISYDDLCDAAGISGSFTFILGPTITGIELNGNPTDGPIEISSGDEISWFAEDGTGGTDVTLGFFMVIGDTELTIRDRSLVTTVVDVEGITLPLGYLAGDWHFDEGTGTVAADHSDFANDGVLGDESLTSGTVPAWNTNPGFGLKFSGASPQRVRFPTFDIKKAKTVHILYYAPKSGEGMNAIIGPLRMNLLTSDQSNGLQWSLAGFLNGYNDGSITDSFRGIAGIQVRAHDVVFGDEMTRFGTLPKGWQLITITKDNVYINGKRNLYFFSGITWDPSSVLAADNGTLHLGQHVAYSVDGGESSNYNSALTGIVGRLIIYDQHFSQAEQDEHAQAVYDHVVWDMQANRGITDEFPYTNVEETLPVIIFVGDSIVQGNTGFETASDYANGPFVTYNLGRGGTCAKDCRLWVQNVVGDILSGSGANILYIGTGSNASGPVPGVSEIPYFEDTTGNDSVTEITAIVDWIAENHPGTKVVIQPMLSRGGGYDSRKNVMNTALITAYGTDFSQPVSVIPLANYPNLVPDGSYANATYFSDEVHPTTLGKTEQVQAFKDHIAS